jgi:hypothetical protein
VARQKKVNQMDNSILPTFLGIPVIMGFPDEIENLIVKEKP